MLREIKSYSKEIIGGIGNFYTITLVRCSSGGIWIRSNIDGIMVHKICQNTIQKRYGESIFLILCLRELEDHS
jgi:hypothetical protein